MWSPAHLMRRLFQFRLNNAAVRREVRSTIYSTLLGMFHQQQLGYFQLMWNVLKYGVVAVNKHKVNEWLWVFVLCSEAKSILTWKTAGYRWKCAHPPALVSTSLSATVCLIMTNQVLASTTTRVQKSPESTTLKWGGILLLLLFLSHWASQLPHVSPPTNSQKYNLLHRNDNNVEDAEILNRTFTLSRELRDEPGMSKTLLYSFI